ncbi:MAG: hypothetical protein ACF8OB_08125 [Phycisphaeraceae bacterium JB051]
MPLTVYLIEAKNQFACPGCQNPLQIERSQAKLSGLMYYLRCLSMLLMLTLIAWILIRIVGLPGWLVMMLNVCVMLAWLFQTYTRAARIILWHPTCVKCEYNLQGILDSGSKHCPECGHEIQWTEEDFKHRYTEKTNPFQWKRIGWLFVVFMILTSGLSAINSLDRYWRVYSVGWPIAYYHRSRTVINWKRFVGDLSIPGFLADCSLGLIAGIVIDQIWQKRINVHQTE